MLQGQKTRVRAPARDPVVEHQPENLLSSPSQRPCYRAPARDPAVELIPNFLPKIVIYVYNVQYIGFTVFLQFICEQCTLTVQICPAGFYRVLRRLFRCVRSVTLPVPGLNTQYNKTGSIPESDSLICLSSVSPIFRDETKLYFCETIHFEIRKTRNAVSFLSHIFTKLREKN